MSFARPKGITTYSFIVNINHQIINYCCRIGSIEDFGQFGEDSDPESDDEQYNPLADSDEDSSEQEVEDVWAEKRAARFGKESKGGGGGEEPGTDDSEDEDDVSDDQLTKFKSQMKIKSKTSTKRETVSDDDEDDDKDSMKETDEDDDNESNDDDDHDVEKSDDEYDLDARMANLSAALQKDTKARKSGKPTHPTPIEEAESGEEDSDAGEDDEEESSEVDGGEGDDMDAEGRLYNDNNLFNILIIYLSILCEF